MAGYKPLKITGMATGLVQEREEFLLPGDAYPILENAFVWRERIKRKQGYRLLGRLRRVLTAQALGNADGGGSFSGNIRTIFTLETNAEIQVGSVVVTDGAPTWTDNGLGVLVGVPSGSGTINYTTTAITISGATPGAALTIAFNYYPELPVMGLRTRELNNINNEQLVAFDQKYAYVFLGGWQEFIPGTTWSGTDSDFFWSTNYWVTPAPSNKKLFWVTNFSTNDPIRYTDDSVWIDFAPTINAAGDKLEKCLAMLPFRAQMMAFNTFEGPNLAGSIQYRQRIRWAAIGNPISDISTLFPLLANTNPNAWRDDIPGQGGYLDIPTSEDIICVGFVRDNLVIYCERSTWQLRYTSRSINPFIIEKVNSELGAESTFSAVQFDTSLVGMGDKGVVECDSFKSNRIDIKIPDLIYQFNNDNEGTKRVHGIRDFQQRLAYWTYPYKPTGAIFPNRRLVYNYENDSWAIFTDSLTTLGTYQAQTSLRWQDVPYPWEEQNYPWINRPSLFPSIVGGNQQGFVEYLDFQTTNDISLVINNITGNTTTPTRIKSVNHNLLTFDIIKITNIPAGTPFATSLNGHVFMIAKISNDLFDLYKYDPTTGQFSIPQTDAPGVYIGGGTIAVRDNFRIVSKKFNMIDDGQNIQLGFIDVLFDATPDGAVTLNIYNDYNDSTPTNVYPENVDPQTDLPDTFFNSVVPTTTPNPTSLESNKYWQRVFCATRAAFLTIEWTLSNAQMNGVEQENDVQIDAQILYVRAAGRQLPIGV